jgi:hypothetical protein
MVTPSEGRFLVKKHPPPLRISQVGILNPPLRKKNKPNSLVSGVTATAQNPIIMAADRLPARECLLHGRENKQLTHQPSSCTRKEKTTAQKEYTYQSEPKK